MIARRFATIGHSRHASDALIGLLRGAGVGQVVDVRRFPSSRYNPQFNRGPLERELTRHGIGYWHAEDLGGRREGRPAAGAANGGWRNAALRAYADYALTAEFQDALAWLETAASDEVPALLCAEADWRACHRQIIADHLLVRGHSVVHILPDGGQEEARSTPFAQIGEDGLVRYPQPDAQLDLPI